MRKAEQISQTDFWWVLWPALGLDFFKGDALTESDGDDDLLSAIRSDRQHTNPKIADSVLQIYGLAGNAL